jgi:hypothetical protein
MEWVQLPFLSLNQSFLYCFPMTDVAHTLKGPSITDFVLDCLNEICSAVFGGSETVKSFRSCHTAICHPLT